MGSILAIETATEACSLALFREGRYRERHEMIPRQHNQRLFLMLRELLPDHDLQRQGVEAIVYGSGPGSFTGLRIAASAVQGLAFAGNLPAVPVSTLACQALTAAREAGWEEGVHIFSTLDARIDEAYCALYRVAGSGLLEVATPRVVAPGHLDLELPDGPVHAVGSGCRVAGLIPRVCLDRFDTLDDTVLPRARDLIPLALEKIHHGEVQTPFQVQPLYIKEEITWDKLPQQGKRR